VGVLGVSLEMECENLVVGKRLNDKMYHPIWFLTSEGQLAQLIVDRKDSQFSRQVDV
jgi:hypothetical protein